MKSFVTRTLVILALASLPFLAGAASETHTFLTIRPDGMCLVKLDATQSRTMFEQQVRVWERYKDRSEVADSEDENSDAPAPEPKKLDTKPYSDEELGKKIREMYQSHGENDEESEGNIQSVEVTKETVRIVQTNSFASIKEMLQKSYSWSGEGGHLGNGRFETDTNHNFRLTFTPYPNRGRYTESLRKQWKLMAATQEYKITLPGKILSSGFSNIQENTTWYVIDPKSEESLNAAVKMVETPVIITAELGGLTLNEPIDSKTVRRSYRPDASEDPKVPVTEAGPGYSAEAVSVTTSTVYYFPEGEKRKDKTMMFGMEKPGVKVEAKLFAPKDREMQAVSDIRVLSVTDDKGRPVEKPKSETENENDEENYFPSSYTREDSEKTASMQISLPLPLPQPDAQSIQDLAAEAVVTTVGSWKEMTLTNLQQNATNEVDLSEILPGAKLVITKSTIKKNNVTLEVELKGPAEVRQLKLVCKTSSENSGSSAYESRFNKKGAQSTRKMSVNAYRYGSDDEEPQPPALLVRFPQDTRREHVKFKLSGLDLF